jgi:hypothetical protein
VGVDAGFSLRTDVIRWRQLKPTGESQCEQVIVRQNSPANNVTFTGNLTALETTIPETNFEMKSEVQEQKFYRMAKVDYCLEMLQGSQNLCATQMVPYTHNKQLTAIGYISDTQEIVNVCWSNFQ